MKEKAMNVMKKFWGSFLLCLMAAVLLPGFTSEAASKKPVCAKSQTVYIYDTKYSQMADTVYSGYIYIKNLDSKAKITNIKSSNKKIRAYYVNNSFQKMNALSIEPANVTSTNRVKSGEKAKITFTVKQNGKSYKLSCRLTFKKAPSPVKTLKIGNKNYASAFKGKSDKTIKISGSKVKISMKAASGFKIGKIQASYSNGKTKKIKNGSKISTKNLTGISVYYSVKKKPTYYQKPKRWSGLVSSPLQEYIYLNVNN